MKINVSYMSTKYYNKSNIIQWVWMFRKYKYVKGFVMRIFGVYINVRESNATEKLIEQGRVIIKSNPKLHTPCGIGGNTSKAI